MVQKYLENVYFQYQSSLLWREFGSFVGSNAVTVFVMFFCLYFFFCGWEVVKVSFSSVNYMCSY